MSFFDDLETRSADQRANDLAVALPAQIANAKKLTWFLILWKTRCRILRTIWACLRML